MPNPRADYQNPLDNPPPFHQKLLDYGERPYWSPDGKKIAFVETNYGDVCEMDVETREIKKLTHNLGDHHSFLRVLYLSNGDYLLIGPKEFKDRYTSRHVESELWVMDKEAKHPPAPLGRRIFEGAGVSTITPKITYAVSCHTDPSLGGTDYYQCHVTDIVYDGDGAPHLGADRVIYRTQNGRRPEPQDFRHGDTEIVMAEYYNWPEKQPDNWKTVVKGVDIATGKVTTFINEPLVHNECEGIFPDGEHICLESSVDAYVPYQLVVDLWKLKLDGSGQRVRMTRMCDHRPWKATNSNVSPDGRWLAFMVSVVGDEAGFGRGLGLLDLAAWEASPESQRWDVAPVSED